jgi:hypothetical protein
MAHGTLKGVGRAALLRAHDVKRRHTKDAFKAVFFHVRKTRVLGSQPLEKKRIQAEKRKSKRCHTKYAKLMHTKRTNKMTRLLHQHNEFASTARKAKYISKNSLTIDTP